ncbi:MAG: hypothetical protein Q9223_004190 [Gallowayella weberi]
MIFAACPLKRVGRDYTTAPPSESDHEYLSDYIEHLIEHREPLREYRIAIMHYDLQLEIMGSKILRRAKDDLKKLGPTDDPHATTIYDCWVREIDNLAMKIFMLTTHLRDHRSRIFV